MKAGRTKLTQSATTIGFAVVLMVALAFGGVGLVAGDEPGEPQSFYGEIETEDGVSAPEGVEVFAVVDGEVEDSIEVDPEGQYGGPGAFEDKLVVNTGAGDEVEFRVFEPDGPEAFESPFDLDDADESPLELDLTFASGTFEEDPELEDLTLELDEETIEEGDTTDATVTALFDDGSEEDVTDEADIESDDENIASVDGATITGESEGMATIYAEFTDGEATETDTADIEVEGEDDPAALDEITLELDEDTIEEGDTTDTTVTALFDDGSEEDVTDEADIESDDEDIASVDGATVTGENEGDVTISAEFTDDDITETDTADLTVEAEDDDPAELDSISLNLDETTIEEGDTTDATVTATFDDGSEENVTDEADIESDDEDIASVDGATITGESGGSTTISADFTDGDITETDTADIEVEAEDEDDDDDDDDDGQVGGGGGAPPSDDDDELAAITLELANTTLEVGEETAATVTAEFEDGSEENVTDDSDIESEDDDIASVEDALITAEAAGTTNITAEFTDDGVTETDSVELEVEDEPDEDATLDAISLELEETTIEEGETTDATVTATFDDDSEADVTEEAEVESDDEEIASVEGATITGESEGEVTIAAEFTDGNVTETDEVTLAVDAAEEPVELESITLDLEETTIDVGETTEATVTVTYDDGSEEDVTTDAALQSNAPDIASVEDTIITGESGGITEINAEFEGTTASEQITVEGDDDGVDTEDDDDDADDEDPDDDGADDDGAGFGVVVALSALLGAALLAVRRRTEN